MRFKLYRISADRKVDRAEHMLACRGEGRTFHLPENGVKGWTCICEGTLIDRECSVWPNCNLVHSTIIKAANAADVIGCRMDDKDVLGLLYGDIVVIQGERIKTRPFSGAWLHLYNGEMCLNDPLFYTDAMEGEAS